jgi:hypothetical protein
LKRGDGVVDSSKHEGALRGLTIQGGVVWDDSVSESGWQEHQGKERREDG